MHSANTKLAAVVLFVIASDAYARGGPGNTKVSLAVIATLAFWGTDKKSRQPVIKAATYTH